MRILPSSASRTEAPPQISNSTTERNGVRNMKHGSRRRQSTCMHVRSLPTPDWSCNHPQKAAMQRWGSAVCPKALPPAAPRHSTFA